MIPQQGIPSTFVSRQALPHQITIVIPTYQEKIDVIEKTVLDVKKVLGTTGWSHQIFVINDGSGPNFDYAHLTQIDGVRVIAHSLNKGYGAALKTGIAQATTPWIGITDADGTYPNWDFPKLMEHADDADMVVGIRRISEVERLRRFPKFVLNRYASFLANETISDLNSGMRIFKRELAMQFWTLYPDGFSFTSTITMATLGHNYAIKDVPIDYYKREGKSSIKPVKDTYRFFKMVGRLGLFFNPLRIFGPIAMFCLMIGLLKGVRDYAVVGHIGNFSLSLFLAGIQIYLMGLIAELISKR